MGPRPARPDESEPLEGLAPKLELEWEEHAFRWLYGLWRRLRPAPLPAYRAEAAQLEREGAALSTVARVLAREAVRLVPARGEGGLRAADLLVPPALDLGGSAEENREALLLRVAVGATIRRLGLDREVPPEGPLRALRSLDAARVATDRLVDELPAFADLHRRVAAAELRGRAAGSPAWDRLRAAALDLATPWAPPAAPPAGDPGPPLRVWGGLVRAPGAVTAIDSKGELPAARSTGAERVGRPADEVERVTVDEERAREKVVQHVFEKVETLDEHQGQVQRMDGADELDDHMEALDELDLKQVIRGGERAESLYRAEIGIDADVPDVADVLPGEPGVTYDEWDVVAGRYKPGWCTVYPTPMGGGDGRWAAGALPRQRALIEDLHRRLVIHRTRRSPVRGQADGEDLDLEALVESFAERRAGRGPLERVYVRGQRRARSFATTVLLDVSLSSDAWVAERRVLDVAREAILVLGEVADRLGDRLQVLAFASHTRNRCRVWTLRDWGDPWALGRARLGSLHPQGYTRIGPALRHAAAELARTEADRKLLLLVSDGKPTDFDRYEGRYGVADVRQALREAEAKGVVTHGLAIDAVARDHLPVMLGPGAWHILPDPRRLPEVLTTVYGRMTGR
jgi:nitric oxide reductase NorD protein